MKKLLIAIAMMLLLTGAAFAEAPVAEPTPTPQPTRVPDMVAVPTEETSPFATATPRPTDAPLPADPFVAHVVEIARRIDLLAKNEMFMADQGYYSWGPDPRIETLAGGDHTMPVRIFSILPGTLIDALYSGMPADAVRMDFSRPELRRDLVESLPDMLTASMDEALVDMNNLLARYKVFAYDAPGQCGMLLLLYADATPVIETWYESEGAIRLSAWFLPDEALAACSSAEEVVTWFAAKGMPAAHFEEVEIK